MDREISCLDVPLLSRLFEGALLFFRKLGFLFLVGEYIFILDTTYVSFWCQKALACSWCCAYNGHMKKFEPCEKCRNQEGPAPGYIYQDRNGYKVAQECECHRLWELESKRERAYIRAGVNTTAEFGSYKGDRSRESVEALKVLSDNFNRFKERTNVYMYGPNGTQKTTMAQVLGKELINRGYSVRYVLMETLIHDLNGGFEKDEDREMRVKEYQEVDCLIIDEAFDTTKVTVYKSGYQLPYLDSFLRERYDQDRKSTVFISNVTPQDISVEKFGASLQNFMVRTTINSFLTFQDEYICQAGVGVPVPDASLFKIRRRVKNNG